ncbi:MAG: radical SAM protein [Egibacteraceae bacterium]
MTATARTDDAEPPAWRSFRSRLGTHVLVLRGSQVLDVDERTLATLDEAGLAPYLDHGERLGLGAVPSVAPQNLSLNVTSACNLACDYCYAGRGAFGGAQVGAMSEATAEQAIDTLLAGCERRAMATIGFLGGEPFLHRRLVHHVVGYASRRAAEVGQPVGFSVTTNGTLLRATDLDLLRSHRFAVTVSLDGGRATHDRRRLTLAGEGSWDDAMACVRPLLADPGTAVVTARATLSSDDLDLAGRYDALAAEGFPAIGFAPVRVGFGALGDDHWPRWLDASIALGERELATIRAGGDTAFDNLRVALRRLEAGSSSPYPCGAGGGYASVSTAGRWFACHRAIGEEDYALGDSDGGGGVDPARQRRFLADRHVERVEPCRSCWARYLCSGGCHQEAATRTTAACDAIRAWLEFCLDAYCVVSSERPDWFSAGKGVV